ncbi:hypothetical protein MTYP_00326 [Methylophilaceae bacterium]|nr:hypothetical protein MTYP_00326 [Methylophilaceae bacterium]
MCPSRQKISFSPRNLGNVRLQFGMFTDHLLDVVAGKNDQPTGVDSGEILGIQGKTVK